MSICHAYVSFLLNTKCIVLSCSYVSVSCVKGIREDQVKNVEAGDTDF